MTPTLVSPATDWDLADLLGVCHPATWGLVRAQTRLGPSWALRDAEGAFAACGLAEIGGVDAFELWFLAHPRARRHLPQMLRIARLTVLPAVDAPIMGRVRRESGRRLARLLGFREIGDDLVLFER